MTEQAPFRVAFLGCGGYSHSLVAGAVSSAHLQPVACYDVSRDACRSFAGQFGIECSDSAEEMLARPDVDGVIIATPNNQHLPCARQAASAGKHVFVDKPVANTLTDAWRMVDACKEAGVTLAVGHNTRRMPGPRKMKAMIDAGEIGTPVTVEANFSHSGGLGLAPGQWRFYRDECPGLPLMQLGVHFADTADYLFGPISEVSSFMTHAATPADNDDVTVQILRFDSGLLGYLGSNYVSPSVHYINVYGTEGNLHCDGGSHLLQRKSGSPDKEPVDVTPVNTQMEELEDWASAAVNKRAPEVGGEEAIRALAVVQAALESSASRTPVRTSGLIERARRETAVNCHGADSIRHG